MQSKLFTELVFKGGMKGMFWYRLGQTWRFFGQYRFDRILRLPRAIRKD